MSHNTLEISHKIGLAHTGQSESPAFTLVESPRNNRNNGTSPPTSPATPSSLESIAEEEEEGEETADITNPYRSPDCDDPNYKLFRELSIAGLSSLAPDEMRKLTLRTPSQALSHNGRSTPTSRSDRTTPPLKPIGEDAEADDGKRNASPEIKPKHP